MNKKIVILFPGISGTEIPLLYFASKHYEDCGYEKVFISHPSKGKKDFETLYQNAKSQIENLDFSQYEEIIFIAKSMGTVIACKIQQELDIFASLILFTPLEETLSYIKRDNYIILIAAGDRDRYLDSETLVAKCELESVPYYIENGVGHRMEVMNDLKRNLTIIESVISRL